MEDSGDPVVIVHISGVLLGMTTESETFTSSLLTPYGSWTSGLARLNPRWAKTLPAEMDAENAS